MVLSVTFLRTDLTDVGRQYFDGAGALIGTRSQYGVISAGMGTFFVNEPPEPGAVGIRWNSASDVTADIYDLLPEAPTLSQIISAVPSVAQIADGVWDEQAEEHAGAGSVGYMLEVMSRAEDNIKGDLFLIKGVGFSMVTHSLVALHGEIAKIPRQGEAFTHRNTDTNEEATVIIE